ncbi:hypothetical protein BGZ94_009611, partial [Podila epigama]
VELLVSNMVLEAEIQAAQEQIHSAKAAGNSDAEEEGQDRLTQLEIKCRLAVKARMELDKKLAVQLKRLGMLTEAGRALKRYKTMAAEMKEVEEAMAAQGEEDE